MGAAIGARIPNGAPIMPGATMEVPPQGDPRRNKLRHRLQPLMLVIVKVSKANRIIIFLIIVYSAEGTRVG